MPLPDRITIRPGFTVPADELRWRYSRSSGPGGQSVNTSDTRVELSFDVARSESMPEPLRRRALTRLAARLTDGVVTVVASEHRSQLRNREAALDRLTELLRTATASPPRPRRPTRPSAGAVERRLAAKHRRSQTKRNRRADGTGEAS